jgi:hypothetical protein
MANLKQRLALLGGERPEPVAAVLLGTLSHANDHELNDILPALLATRRPEAIAGVIRSLHRLEDEGGSLISSAGVDFGSGIVHALDQPRPRTALNVLLVIQRRCEARLPKTSRKRPPLPYEK